MARLSELEQFLQEQVREGQTESSGVFTLAREKALEKLGAFQLPRPTAWVLKLVQAAVAGGASELVIRQTATDTEFYFTPSETWTLDEFADSFHDPQVSPRRSLDHLKRGLWSVALNDMHPFRISVTGASEGLIWSGADFRRIPCPTQKNVSVTVSHRTAFEARPKPGAAEINAAISSELSGSAFICPIPLSLDGRRLDRLQGCPGHGFSMGSYPLKIGFLETEGPTLPIPPGTFAGLPVVAKTDPLLTRLLQSPQPVRGASAACILSIHYANVPDRAGYSWSTLRQACTVQWAKDGVIIQRDTMKLQPTSVSVGLILTADGLATDLSGFQLVQAEAREQRLNDALEASRPLVAATELSMSDFIQDSRSRERKTALVFVAGGGLLALAWPLGGTVIAGYAALMAMFAGTKQRLSSHDLQKDLVQFKIEWATFKGDLTPPPLPSIFDPM